MATVTELVEEALKDNPASMDEIFKELMMEKVKLVLETKKDQILANIHNIEEDLGDGEDDEDEDEGDDDEGDDDEGEDDEGDEDAVEDEDEEGEDDEDA